ncbi:Crp/Fnr family transcriptional regulator [Chitinophaga arvensicola]|uniref:cAMP-binding domain of CRP or a regulatory subunit of cAMP-dependent protein kinases n=1 Tax=Chitinophaga arvensicola TaxID=29529 RepID=A0A1I0S8F2_9BACT|nr:Crp/Fnr family transcriptional regulator [Chitinophaga arvensicola]SEW52306.1 cAMP-binding domain of CRP or a regulatory subunit of cAMP-dependent protein kinases [Chitinophaga arvensicola]
MSVSSNYYDMIIDHVCARVTLTEDEKQRFCDALVLRHLLPRQYLLQQGDICRHESFVCKGFLRSFYVDDQGDEHTLHFAMEDWWISDLQSFIRQEPATRNIIATEPVTVLQLEKQAREELLKEIPALERFWRVLNENACAAQDQRILSNITSTGAERYIQLLKKYPSIDQRMSQKHIASYLGITPVFLSQIRKKNLKN